MDFPHFLVSILNRRPCYSKVRDLMLLLQYAKTTPNVLGVDPLHYDHLDL